MRIPRFLLLLALVLPTAVFASADPEPSTADKDYKPLTASQRGKYFLDDTLFRPGLYLAAAGSGLGEHINNKPPEWKQGAKGYFHRAGSQLAMFAVDASISNAGAAVLHYDPRYIRSGNKGFAPRLAHAIGWSFLTYDDQRHIRPNLPVLAGAYGSGMISTYWYPARFDPLKDGVRSGNIQLGSHVLVNIFKEFSPELKRVLKKK